MNIPCTTLSLAEVDSTFFGQGKRQKEKAVAMCQTCPIMLQCENDARNMEVIIGTSVIRATGVFGAKVFVNGEVSK